MAKQIGHKPPDGRSGRIGGSGSHGSRHTVLAVCDRHGVPSVAPPKPLAEFVAFKC